MKQNTPYTPYIDSFVFWMENMEVAIVVDIWQAQKNNEQKKMNSTFKWLRQKVV